MDKIVLLVVIVNWFLGVNLKNSVPLCYYILLNVGALRAVQTSGPNDTKHVLVTRGPFLISGNYGSRGRYIEQIKTGQNIDQQD